MRFSLGLLVGYCLRGKKHVLITVLAITTIAIFIVVPAMFLTGLAISRQQKPRQPPQTRVPFIQGLKRETAEARLHAANLKMEVLASRSDLSIEPGVIINQVPQSGQDVDLGYVVGVTISAKDLQGPGP